jgi:hypothetical protein
MTKRRDLRVKKKYMVSFDDSGFDGLGLTSDISKNGICVSAGTEFPVHHEVVLSVAVPGRIFTLKGEVMWCKHSSDTTSDIPDNIGIKITDAPADYLNYVEYVKHRERTRRDMGLFSRSHA